MDPALDQALFEISSKLTDLTDQTDKADRATRSDFVSVVRNQGVILQAIQALQGRLDSLEHQRGL